MLAEILKQKSKEAQAGNMVLQNAEQLKASMEYTQQYNRGVETATNDLPNITEHLYGVAKEGAVTFLSSYQTFVRSPELPAYYAGYAKTVVEHFQKEGLDATLLVSKHIKPGFDPYYNFSFEFSW